MRRRVVWFAQVLATVVAEKSGLNFVLLKKPVFQLILTLNTIEIVTNLSMT